VTLPLAVNIVTEVGDALSFAFGMLWQILWALILGFARSAVVQAVVSKGEMRRLLSDDSFGCSIGNVPLAAMLVWRFARTGGLPMLRMMNKPAELKYE
jgi:hypothetical protein